MSNYETRHPDDMVLHPLSEIREWDEALAVLGIQDSTQTPAEAVRERDAEIDRLRERARDLHRRAQKAEGALERGGRRAWLDLALRYRARALMAERAAALAPSLPNGERK